MTSILRNTLFISVLTVISTVLSGQINLQKISTYNTGAFAEGATEIVSFDPGSERLFSVNAFDGTVDIIDFSDPANPTLISQINLAPYGDAANSVKVFNGIVAAAVAANVNTDPGKVVFFDTAGTYLADYPAGANPDMIVFTHDGSRVLVANEGEPDDDYTIDPEGSVTIVDISGGVVGATVIQVTFNQFDGKEEYLRNKGVRIFGPGASASQDIEPEYITVLDNDSMAYVALQENNALAVLNINQGVILDVIALGEKDHSKGLPTLENIFLNQEVSMPQLGSPVYDGGQPMVFLSGFSGMHFDGINSSATNYIFYVIPDRGPNDETASKNNVTPTPGGNLRPFKLPDYQARIVKFEYDPITGNVTLDSADQIFLYAPDGTTPISGKGNVAGFDEVPVTYYDPNTVYNTIDYVDNTSGEEFTALPFDRFGGDFEGIVRDNVGNFFMCDEYRPAIYKFDANGTMIDRFVPDSTHTLANPQTPSDTAGHYGSETLPQVYNKRWANRGFEAIAYDYDNDVIYAFIQSPIDNPSSSIVRNKSDVIRVLGIDPATGLPVAEYVYLLERNAESGYSFGRTDKIGDAVYIGSGKFLLIERDSSDPLTQREGKKLVYQADFNFATNILGTPLATRMDTSGGNSTLEMLSADDLAAQGISPMYKTLVCNLSSLGYQSSDKPEGIAFLPGGDIAVLNDNDFGLAGAGYTDNSTLGIISFDTNYGIDASDDDGIINITNWPTLGYFMPDAIANYTVNGMSYILTANEGDSRDYDGYSEEERVKDLTLDAAYFPNAVSLQQDENLGRLKTTSANGDIDGDGDFDYVYSYGGRSFSIFDRFGNRIWDSGNEFAKYLEVNHANDFNSSNDDNSSFDNRSDDKGSEPEAITIAEWNGSHYAFIGLERMGGIMVYNIDDPTAPSLELYELNRDFSVPADSFSAGVSLTGDLGPEDIIFIDAADSPDGKYYIVVANEVSGTITTYEVNNGSIGFDSDIAGQEQFRIYPNPSNQSVVYVSHRDDYTVYDATGRTVLQEKQTMTIDISSLKSGIYIVRNSRNSMVKFIRQ